MQKCTIALPSPLSFCQSNVIHPNDVNNIFLMSVMSIMSMNSIISIVFKMVKTGLSISVSHLCLILRWTGYWTSYMSNKARKLPNVSCDGFLRACVVYNSPLWRPSRQSRDRHQDTRGLPVRPLLPWPSTWLGTFDSQDVPGCWGRRGGERCWGGCLCWGQAWQ